MHANVDEKILYFALNYSLSEAGTQHWSSHCKAMSQGSKPPRMKFYTQFTKSGKIFHGHYQITQLLSMDHNSSHV